jgi:MFS family permease
MLSQQIRNSGSLLDSIDAIRNWRAVLLLLATLVATALVMGVGSLLAMVSWFFVVLFALAAYAVLFYGANAAGMMIMDEAKGYPSRPAMAAIMASLATSHRLILVFLLLGAVYLAGFLVLAIVLFICKIPFLGPVLYAVVFPLSVVIAGIAMFALPTVVFPLSAPSIWSGATTMQCVSQLLAIARKRLLLVLLLMIAVAFIAGIVAFLIGAILFSGVAITGGLSVGILGGAAGMGGMVGGVMGGGMPMGMGGMGAMGSFGGHAAAAAIGGGILFAVAFTLPGMVYLRGACTVYLRAIDGLDLQAEQAAIDGKIAAARAKARDMQAQAQATAQQYASRPAAAPAAAPAAHTEAAPAPARAAAAAAAVVPPVAVAPVAPPPVVTAPAPAPGTMAMACPNCRSPILASDLFCGECGHKLQ